MFEPTRRELDIAMQNMSVYDGRQVYHGGIVVVEQIELHRSKIARDFGVGFYLTTYKEQAESWTRSKRRRSKNASYGVVNKYEILSFAGLECLVFTSPNEDWLDFVVMNRNNLSRINTHQYDIVIGPVADDDTMVVIENYMAGVYAPFGSTAKAKVIEYLEPEKLKNQIALCTAKAVAAVKYSSHYTI